MPLQPPATAVIATLTWCMPWQMPLTSKSRHNTNLELKATRPGCSNNGCNNCKFQWFYKGTVFVKCNSEEKMWHDACMK